MATVELDGQIAIVNELILCNIPNTSIQTYERGLDPQELVLLRKVPTDVELRAADCARVLDQRPVKPEIKHDNLHVVILSELIHVNICTFSGQKLIINGRIVLYMDQRGLLRFKIVTGHVGVDIGSMQGN